MRSAVARNVSQLWIIWLTIACCLVIGLSLALVLLPSVGQLGFNRLLFGRWAPPADFSAAAVRYVTFVYGVLGAVMIGWMIALLAIIHRPFAAGERWAWNAIAGSAGFWFLIDSAFSWHMRFHANLILNALFVAMFAVPLIGSARSFRLREP